MIHIVLARACGLVVAAGIAGAMAQDSRVAVPGSAPVAGARATQPAPGVRAVRIRVVVFRSKHDVAGERTYEEALTRAESRAVCEVAVFPGTDVTLAMKLSSPEAGLSKGRLSLRVEPARPAFDWELLVNDEPSGSIGHWGGDAGAQFARLWHRTEGDDGVVVACFADRVTVVPERAGPPEQVQNVDVLSSDSGEGARGADPGSNDRW